MSESERIKTICPTCNAKLAVAAKYSGKNLRCPKCQAVVLVPVQHGITTATPPALPVLPEMVSAARTSDTKNTNLLVKLLFTCGIIFAGVVTVFIVTQYVTQKPVSNVAAQGEGDTKANANQIKVAVNAMPVEEKPIEKIPVPPAIVPDQKEQLREAFIRLKTEVEAAHAQFDKDAKPLQVQIRDLQFRMDYENGRGTPEKILEYSRENSEIMNRFLLLQTQYELTAAKSVKRYIEEIEQLGIPESLTEEFEQELISKALLSVNVAKENESTLKRFQSGGANILQTRAGRMWVLFNVRVTL